MHFLHSPFLIQFLLSEDIPQMPRDDRLIPLKQLRHLRLGQPDSFLLQADIKASPAPYPQVATGHTHPSSSNANPAHMN
jgi:hypothetical protein